MLPELDTGVIICQTIWVSEQWEKKVELSISFLWHPTCSFMTYFLPGFPCKITKPEAIIYLGTFQTSRFTCLQFISLSKKGYSYKIASITDLLINLHKEYIKLHTYFKA